MTRIDFYSTDQSRLQTACRIVAKALTQDVTVTLFAPDNSVARAIDKLLWAHPATSFVPHCFSTDRLAANTPVLITSELANSGPDELLLNLADTFPTAFGRYRRLIEIVSSVDGDPESARSRWRQYKERGYEVNHVNLAKGQTK
ncbi:MAG: DNA polymerase III subunit chi [Burkholderiales bacterium]